MNKILLLSLFLFFVVSAQAQVKTYPKLDKTKQNLKVAKGKLTIPSSQLKNVQKTTGSPEDKNRGLSKSSPFKKLPHQKTYGHKNCQHEKGFCDPRDLPLSKNGKLLSVDGYEVDFKTSANRSVTNTCGTPRGYVNAPNTKSAGCPFTVACDDPSNRDAAPTTIKYFQLVWHVMQSTTGGASSNIDQVRIDALMAELNTDYGTHNMIFCADPATFYVDDANYTHNSATEEVSLKTTYNSNPTQLINIYIVGSMTAGGYARFPYDPMGGTSTTGGIVLNRGNCNIGTHTLAHEMGHTFGLEHTFSGVDERTQCSACYEQVRNVNGSSNTTGIPTPLGGPYTTDGDQEGDWCSDTHPHDTYSYNCSTSPNANGGCDSNPWANAPVNNHMSYSFCSSQFTDQQSSRMHCMTATYLNSWISYGGGICGAQPPVADFDGSPTAWIAPSNVLFNDLSTPQSIITSWTWVLDVAASGTVTCVGCVGANATFVGQTPPAVTYPNVGLYTVSLTVTSANGPDTETKVDYIEVTAPANDCDTLDTDWFTPVTSYTYYSGGFGFFTGVPCEGSNLPEDPAGFYQQYFTPTPGTSIVGAVTVGLGLLVDADNDMTFTVVVYEDDPLNPGFPDWGAGPLATRSYSPTDIGVSTTGLSIFDIPFTCAPTIVGATFHVGVEMFPGDPTDQLILITNTDGEGGGALTNTYLSSFCASQDYNVGGMLCGYPATDFDLLCYPQMGWYAPTPLAAGYVEDVRCDTTDVAILTATLYDGALCAAPSGPNTGMVNWTYLFPDGTTYSSPTEIPILYRTYTTPGPDQVLMIALNDCGRADTTLWTIPYNFMSTPDADFTKTPLNPICAGAPGVTFTANTSGYADYTWDFGDGTPPISSAGIDNITHIYPIPGTYYTELSVTSLGYESISTFYLEDFAGGIPAGYATRTNDPFTPNAIINPPFTGTNATAWAGYDVDNSGDNEAVSCSWHTVAGQQADDWMVTSAIGVLPANQMLSWDAEAISAPFPDGYEVRISTTGQLPVTTANFNTVLFSTAAENSFNTSRTANLSAYAGQTIFIAFRNNSTDQFLLSIDNIKVGTIGTGCTNSEQKLDYVEIIDCTVIPPTADFSAAPITGCVPLDVTFADITSVGDPATSWLWNFGDAQFSMLQNPAMHTYTSAGNYYVIYQACNSGGCTIDTITVIVGDGVNATAGSDQNVCSDATTLVGNNPAPFAGLWTVVSGSGTFTNATLYNTTVTNLGNALNIFRWTITGTAGCVSSDDVRILAKNFIYGLNGDNSNTFCTDASGWQHFFDGSNEILLSIRGDLSGADLGFPLITINDNGVFHQQTQGPFTAPQCVSGLTPGEERFEMERSWNVDLGPTGTTIGTYNVRFYYQPAERSDIETAAANWITTYPTCSYTYKYPTPLGFYWFKNTGSNYTAPDYDGILPHLAGTVNTVSGINYTELAGITSFSGGSGAIILIPDPLLNTDWLYFDGVTDNKVNYLRWATEAEQNSSHFNLQRSKAGVNFEAVGTVQAQGNSTTTHQYNYDDVNPLVGENYYRLELVDADGNPSYSNTVLLVIADSDLGYIFYPNPTNNIVNYQYEATTAEKLEIEVIDILGRVLKTKKITSVIGINNIPISLEEFAVGSYMVRVYNNVNGSVHTSKIIRSER